MAKKGKEFEFQFNISAEMEQSFKTTMGATEKNIKEIEKELRDIQKSNSFKSVERDMRKAGKAAGSLETEMKGISEIFGDVTKYAGAFALLTGAASSVEDMAGAIFQLDSSMGSIEAATGLTAKEMKEVEESAKAIYAMGLGESFIDISNKITTVKQNTKATGDELENLTKQAMIFEDTFGEGVAESTRSADMLMKQFNVTSTQAYSLMAQGMQGGLNKTNELLDTINEFTPQFKVLGYTAEEMFDFFGAGLDSGAWNLDKVGDLVKEFDNRLKDTGDKNFRDSFAALFSDKADSMLKGLSDGSLRGAEVFSDILKELSAMEDSHQRQTYGIALMGTQYEDLGQKVVNSLSEVESRFDSTKATMEEIEAIKYDNLMHDFKELGRELMDEFILPLDETLIPALEDLAAWGKDNKELIKNMALLVPTVAVGKKMGQFATSIGSLGAASKGAGLGVKALGLATGLLGGPVGIGITALGGITLAVSAYKKRQEEARQELLHLGDSMSEAYGNYNIIATHADTVHDLIDEYDILTGTINNATAPTDELEEARRRLLEVEQQLIDLNPNILTAESAKTDLFKEQLGYIKDIEQRRKEEARRDLEVQYINNKDRINNLEKEYNETQKLIDAHKEQYETNLAQHKLFGEFEKRYQDLRVNPNLSFEESRAMTDELVNDIYEATGDVVQAGGILDYLEQAKRSINEHHEIWNSLDDDINTAEESFQKIYDTAKAYIESGLDKNLDETIANFYKLSQAEQGAFVETLKMLDELNKELDLLPDYKKVNVQVLYDQAFGTNIANRRDMNIPGLSNLEQYADGGFASKASIFGEAGLEAAIPIDNRQRSHDILDKVNRMMGHSTGGDNININFSPNVYVSGSSGNIKKEVTESLKMTIPEFKHLLEETLRQDRRLGMK